MIKGIVTLWAVLLLMACLVPRQSVQQTQQSRRQQQHQEKQLMEPDVLAVDGSQASSSFGGHNGEYSSLVADNLINLGQPLFTNNKRARKMSAFMPMRGKKASGLESDLFSGARSNMAEQQLDGGSEQLLSGGGAPLMVQFRETDGDSSIFRLVMANQNNNNNGQNNLAQNHLQFQQQQQPVAAMTLGLGTPAPRQFANQFAARHLMLAPAFNFANEQPTLLSDTSLTSSGLSSASSGAESPNNNQMMQAKLRRAFHPMRGKKSSVGTAFPAFMQEVSYPDDMQSDG